MRERTSWIDAARGLAVSLVVLLHATDNLDGVGFPIAPWLFDANDVLEGFRMPTVVMISGLLAAGVHSWPWREVLRRRVGPLLLLYVVWTPIAVILIEWMESRTFSLQHDVLELMFVRPEWRMWYFFALALYILAARALRGVPTVVLLGVGVVVNLVAVAWVFTANLPLGADAWGYVLRYWVFFVAAERLSKSYYAIGARHSLGLAVLATVAFLGFGLFVVAEVGAEEAGNAIAMLTLGVLGSAFTLTVMPLVGATRGFAWARAIGRRTLGVYALQFVVVTAFIALLYPIVPTFWGSATLVPIGIAALAVAGSYGCARALLRWAPVPFLRPWWDTTTRMPAPERERPAAVGD